DFDDGVDGGTLRVEVLNAREIFFGERARCELSGPEAVLKFRDCYFIEIEAFRFLRRWFGAGSAYEGGQGERSGADFQAGLEKASARRTAFGGVNFRFFRVHGNVLSK